MSVRHISASNFKTFNQLDVELRGFNVLVGANAAGKSNFVSVFRFLRDIGEFGIENAISLQGGGEYLTNMTMGPGSPVTIRVVITPENQNFIARTSDNRRRLRVQITESAYELALRF